MIEAEFKPPPPARLGFAVLVAILHLIAVAVLIRAFAPQLSEAIVRPVTAAFDVTVTTPPRSSPPPERKVQVAAKQAAGAAAPVGKKATPREVVAPASRIILAHDTAPPVAAAGSADAGGAGESGRGTGAGGVGTGPGAGLSGSGPGGGGAARPVKIAGDIVSAKDYPRAGRKARLGSSVTVVLRIGPDGQVDGCRVARPSRDAEADRITCRLATERFRFRPARDAFGRPVASTYGWQQRWFTPGDRKSVV